VERRGWVEGVVDNVDYMRTWRSTEGDEEACDIVFVCWVAASSSPETFLKGAELAVDD
jgi:hypothetical protein